MHFHELVAETFADTKNSLWPVFATELCLCATILLMILVRVTKFGQYIPGGLMAAVGCGFALYYSYPWTEGIAGRTEIFTGMLVYDEFTCFIRAILLGFTLLFILFTSLSGIPDSDTAVDFYCLILGSVLGMCLMASANHLMIVFMAVEMASVPSYALAGLLKGRRKSSEAALKYAIYGAGAAGIMLYGISLLAGITNSAHLPTIAAQLSDILPNATAGQQSALFLAGLMIAVGLAFKLSAFPFHFWCPDVFEGASAEVNAFLSVASKAAALALVLRIAIGVGFIPSESAEAVATGGDAAQTKYVSDHADHGEDSAQTHEFDASVDPLQPVRTFVSLLVSVIAIVTCTFGNLAAYAQTNIKRLMAYSTIAHAGYMMMAIPAAITVASVDANAARYAVSALGLYIAVYVFMNLVAFAIIAFLRNSTGSEEISSYGGLVGRAPVVAVVFSLTLFSLVGLPPLAGFLGKFAIFAAIAQSYDLTGRLHLILLLIFGGLNTAVSLFYYLRVVKVMTIDPQPADMPEQGRLISNLGMAYVLALSVPIVTLLVYLQPLSEWTTAAASNLF
ncbi:MAG: NADH-quinone oxidoreductase subunit N [Pirellulaceae bacterium]